MKRVIKMLCTNTLNYLLKSIGTQVFIEIFDENLTKSRIF